MQCNETRIWVLKVLTNFIFHKKSLTWAPKNISAWLQTSLHLLASVTSCTLNSALASPNSARNCFLVASPASRSMSVKNTRPPRAKTFLTSQGNLAFLLENTQPYRQICSPIPRAPPVTTKFPFIALFCAHSMKEFYCLYSNLRCDRKVLSFKPVLKVSKQTVRPNFYEIWFDSKYWQDGKLWCSTKQQCGFDLSWINPPSPY